MLCFKGGENMVKVTKWDRKKKKEERAKYRAEIKLGSSVQYVYFKITSSGSYITVR